MVANILPAGLGLKDKNLTFSEHGHVVYQIKENWECSKMVANILFAAPQPALVVYQ